MKPQHAVSNSASVEHTPSDYNPAGDAPAEQASVTNAQHKLTLHWFALKVFYNKVFAIERELIEAGIEPFVPTERVARNIGGKVVFVRRPVISSLVFFRTTRNGALRFAKQAQGRAMLYMQRDGFVLRPHAIPDEEMACFQLVVRTGEAGLTFLEGDPQRFQRGDRVRVTGGTFAGAEGYICRIKSNRRLVVTIEGLCAVATTYIPQCHLEKV